MSDDVFVDGNGGINGGLDRVPSATEATPADIDAVFAALAVRRRRYVLFCLQQAATDALERSQLIEAIRRVERGTGESDGPPPAERVRTDLHHVQLPNLDEAGFLEYDPRQGTVRYGGAAALEDWVTRACREEGLRGCSNDS